MMGWRYAIGVAPVGVASPGEAALLTRSPSRTVVPSP